MRAFRCRSVALGVLLVLATVAASMLGEQSASARQLPPSPLSLSSNSGWNNPNAPTWCLAEDDYHQRVYAGSVSGSYAVTETLCGLPSDYYNGLWWDAGGIGLESDVYVVGQLHDLTVTSPGGSVHHAVLMGQGTAKGTTTYHYAVCYVPAYSISTGTGGTPLPGGTWQVTLSGQISSARWAVNAQMTAAPFQRSYCPASEQNLTP